MSLSQTTIFAFANDLSTWIQPKPIRFIVLVPDVASVALRLNDPYTIVQHDFVDSMCCGVGRGARRSNTEVERRTLSRDGRG